jgi:hypothetical protein
MFSQESLNEKYRRGSNLSAPELDVPDFDFAAPTTQHPIMTRRIGMSYRKLPDDWEPEFFDMGPFQITYNFSRAIRNNNFPVKNALFTKPKMMKEYGASGWSFRMLYEFLCTVYNGNVPFIDTYFERVFKTRPVYAKFRGIYDAIQDDIDAEQFDLFQSVPLKADGTPDMRYAISRKFMDFKVWQDPIIQRRCEILATQIRFDIEACLRDGILQLSGRAGTTVASRTRKIRAELGGMIHPDRLFYASGQLIGHLNIFVEIGEKAA